MSRPAIQDIYPLSPMQQGMLFHTVFEEGAEAYFEQVRIVLTGDLDPAAFRRAWQQVVDRHAVLRSGFYWKRRDEPFQIVQARVELPWEELDWRDLAPDAQQARVKELAAADRARGFTLDRPPLLRITLVRLAEERWQLIWSHHHILLDGWCRPIVVGEVLAFYDALRHGRALELAPSRPYRDYIAWLKRQDRVEAEAFWRRALAGLAGPTPLPADRPARAEVRPDYQRRESRLPAGVLARLLRFARQHQLTLSAVAQSLWGLLLARSSGEEDVVFGAVVSGRPAELPGVETMIGLFINTLPVRVHVARDQAVLAWLAEQMARQIELRRFEHSALVDVRRWSGAPAGRPLFESLIVFQNLRPASPGDGPRDLGLSISEPRVAESADHPLVLVVEPEEELTLRFEYDASRFEATTIGRLLGQLGELFAALPAALAGRLGELSHLTTAERHQLLVEWNATGEPLSGPADLVSLLAERSRRWPGALAAVSAGERLTYRELDRRSNRLAHYLRGRGAGAARSIGLAVARSVETAVALLGILKAGAAYLPLDPAYPAERLRYMAEQADARLVVGRGEPLPALLAAGACWVDLVGEAAAIAAASESPPPVVPEPEDLAYVIYTSGSTGRPKGVAMAHRALVHYAVEMARRLELRADDRVLQFASLSFDVLLEELLPTWVAGGAVVFHGDDLLASPAELQQVITERGVTALELPAAFWHEWVRELGEAGGSPPASLRFLIVGSEKPSPERLAAWGDFGIPLLYVFGLTETAITSTLHWFDGEAPRSELPIGRPVANTSLYLLDAAGLPAAMSIAGELYIGGVGLARGYVGRPDLTAERFVPDRFSGGSGSRLYRTGDRARHRLDGSVDFLGRIDFQVKIRGFRVEPGEVEQALWAHPELAAAAVVARPLPTGGQRLVAYVVPKPGFRPAVEGLRVFLAARLPDFMVPAAFITLSSLPLSPNGKLDRGALPEPEGERPDLDQGYVAPSSPAEEQLAAIWAQVLRIEKIGVHDDFFALGGDSILSLQIVAKAQRVGWRITPKLLFENPTIAGLAAASLGAAETSAEQGPVAGTAELFPVQHWFFDQGFADPHWFNLPLLLDLGELGQPGLVEGVLARLTVHHDALRVRFEPVGGGWRQVGDPVWKDFPVPRVDLSSLPAGLRAATLGAAADTIQAGFDLVAGPLFKAVRFDLGAAGQRLLLLAHHLVMDAVSLRILVEDLVAGCLQILAGEALSFFTKSSSWKVWAERLAAHAASREALGELEYWATMAGAAIGPLPLELPGGKNREAAAETVVARLPPEETRALLTEVPRPYRTQMLDALLATLAEAFAEWSGARRLLVELEGHGREEVFEGVDLSRTVGWFASLYPVLVDISGVAGPGPVVKAVKEQLRAIPHRGFYYGVLRYLGAADTAARLAALPRPQVLFNYLGQVEAGGDDGLPVHPAAEPIGASQSPRAERPHLFEINAAISGAELQVAWSYSTELHRRETVERLAASHLEALRRLIAHCRTPGVGGFTPSDFPLAKVDVRQLDALVETFGGAALEDVYPLSPLQEGMLFHALYEPEAGLYIGQLSYRLDGELDEPAFREAWRHVVERHPVLRTAFLWSELDRPLQVVVREVELPWEAEDWRHLPPAEQEERLTDRLLADRRRGFDPQRAPLQRFTLLRLGDEAWQFVWTHHQMLLDGWSLPLVLEDVFVVYEAVRHGRAPQLPPVRPYRDYIAWLAGQDVGRAEDYWRRTLAGVPGATEIEVARRQEAPTGPADKRRQLSPAVTGELGRFARGHQLTLNSLVQGAWALLLARYSGAPAVVFGAVVAGRPGELRGVERIVGLFINTLPVRTNVAPRERVLPWLKRLQQGQIESVRYEWSALSEVQRWSEVPAGEPLFTTILAFQNQPSDEALADRAKGFTASRGQTAERTNYPLTVVAEPGRRLALMIEHDRSRFDDAAVERMLGHLETFLSALADGPHRLLEDLGLLAEWEREQVLRQWQGENVGWTTGTLGGRLGSRAASQPDAIAAVAGAGHLSYGELSSRGAFLAGYLEALGTGPETVVGLCVERSLELVVGTWGALLSGASYVPLDPDYPGERLA
ncbi:MAG: hypothetical protein QOJ16_1593, partial [Acidobacteriota bacterium]|nr:hypothetical protein [Acidobacteriota bacterium]